MAKPEPADRALQGHTELRDRIEAAMRRDDFSIVTMADAVLPVVEAALAKQAADIDEEIIKPERALHEQTIKRAEQAEHERDTAEGTVRRVRHVLAWKTLLTGPQAEKAVRVTDVEAALAIKQPKETRPAEHVRGANAEDCPACAGRRDLPYPFICPGTDPAAPDTEGPVPDQCRTCESYILPDGIGWRHALGPADHTPEPALHEVEFLTEEQQ